MESNQPQKTNIANSVLQNYIDISSLPLNKRQKALSDFSAEDKANVFKLHLALQLANRPTLTADQKDVILESTAVITPDTYDRTKDRKNTESTTQKIQVRATSIFSRQEAVEIFATMGSGQSYIEYLQKYLGLADLKMMSERKEFFRNASSQDKSQYWKIHFAYNLVVFPNLNNQQKEIILEAMALTDPQIFEVSKTSPDWKIRVDDPSKSLSARAIESFSKEEGGKNFIKLAGEFEPELRPSQCDCLRGSLVACWIEFCSRSSCSTTQDGCGLFWHYSCDGSC